MAAKQAGLISQDGSKYVTSTDGNGSLLVIPATSASGGSAKKAGLVAPDGSFYAVLTNGSGTLV